MIKVIAAGIIKNNKVLIAQRPKNKTLALKWEFPGGKLEYNETTEECLIREIKEELDLDIIIDKYIGENSYKYDFGEVKMILYTVSIKSGEPKLLEHIALKWVTAKEISNYEFPNIDIPFIELIKKELNAINN